MIKLNDTDKEYNLLNIVKKLDKQISYFPSRVKIIPILLKKQNEKSKIAKKIYRRRLQPKIIILAV